MWKVILATIINWTWCLPQNLLGLMLKLFLLIRDKKYYTEKFWDVTVCKTFMKRGSVSLGRYMFLCENHWYNDYVMCHEAGHSYQSYILGPLYLLVIGIPSLLWAAYFHKFGEHYYTFYTEKWANKLGGVKFEKGSWSYIPRKK